MTPDPTTHDPLLPVGASPLVILPDPSHIFLDRARRLAALAEGHSLADWLSFICRLTRVQHELLQKYPSLPLPDQESLASARKDRQPSIPASFLPRDPFWRQALAGLARELAPHAPPPARKTLEQLQAMDDTGLESLAEQVLMGGLDGPNANFFPFVAAALQVHWTALAARLDRTEVASLEMPGACPVCGFPPVAGIVRMGGEVPRLRYLHCALCNTEWNLVRVTCAACRDSNSIAYYQIEGSDGSMRAETCDICRSYLKIVYQEKSSPVDPVADDLATLALDLLVEEAGYDRMSLNLLLAPALTPVSGV
jgi:FdhE protein